MATNPKSEDYPTNYALRKPTVSLEAARALYTPEFAFSAFEAGAHQAKATAASGDEMSALDDATLERIFEEGEDALAISCLAYVLAIEHKVEPLPERKILDGLRQVANGAKQITKAADAMAGQLGKHHEETGQIDEIRAETLYSLGRALHGEFDTGGDDFKKRMSPRRLAGSPLAGMEMTHGLASCAQLANVAEQLLKDYHKWTRSVRAAKSAEAEAGVPAPKALPMNSGRRPDRDRDAFIADLADIYERAFERSASANRGSFTSGAARSPFVRFIDRVFEELGTQSYILDDDRFGKPSVDAVRTALVRTRGAEND